MVKVESGDILDYVGKGVIAHQVNCKGVMGAGMALAIRTKYPEVYREYKEHCRRRLIEDLKGSCLLVKADDGNMVGNLFGQIGYGRDVVHTNVELLKSAIKDLVWKVGNKPIYLPYNIGCVNGGGDFVEVYKMVNEVIDELGANITFVQINVNEQRKV